MLYEVITFLDQIAEFIAAKAYERKEKVRTGLMIELMRQIIDKTNKGVIILNRAGQVTDTNQNARAQLNLPADILGKPLDFEATGDSFGDNDEFRIRVNGKDYFLAGNVFPVDLDLDEYAKIFIFNDMKAVKSRIYQLTRLGETVKIDDILGRCPAMQELMQKVKIV